MKRHSFSWSLILFLSATIISGFAFAADLHLAEPLQNGPYAVDGNITAELNCVVGPDKVVLTSATGTISLNPGFHAQTGGTFRAKSGEYGNLDQGRRIEGQALYYFRTVISGFEDEHA